MRSHCTRGRAHSGPPAASEHHPHDQAGAVSLPAELLKVAGADVQSGVGAFSGTLLECEGRRAIVINDAHGPARQASTLAHECSHVLLDHEPSQHFADSGARVFDAQVEPEADWLAGCLLVPTKAVLPVYRRCGKDLDRCAAHFGVSEQMMRQRFNLSGARTILARTGARRPGGR